MERLKNVWRQVMVDGKTARFFQGPGFLGMAVVSLLWIMSSMDAGLPARPAGFFSPDDGPHSVGETLEQLFRH